jgi:ribosomal protein L17
MRKKELRELAKKIAVQERIIQESSDQKAINRAMEAIVTLSSKVSSLSDITIVDEMVQDILKEKN